MGKKVLLTISILISDRPDTVTKCLDSVQPLLRAVPSELILTDTGCGEKVRSIIEEYTDKIIDFVWCNDFSKARNVGLEKANGEWFLFLDDDEWFENVDEIIEFFTSGEYKNYGMCGYYQRNYQDYEGTTYSELAVGRMIRLDPGVKFIYSIHECFNQVPGKVKMFHSYVHHYGYVYKNDAERQAHAQRNLVLLLKEHEKNPGNMKHVLQIVQEYNSLEDYDKSMEFSLEGIAFSKKEKIEMEFCLPSLFVNMVSCDILKERWEEAIRTGEKYLKEEPLDPLARVYIAGYLAEAWMEKGHEEHCISYVASYWDGYQALLREENIYLSYITTVTADCFEPYMRSKVLGCGVRAAIRKKTLKLARKWFYGMEWKKKPFFASRNMVHDVVHAVGTCGEKEYPVCIQMCSTMLEREELVAAVRADIEACLAEAEGEAQRQERIRRFAALDSNNWYIDLLKVVGERADENAEAYLENVWSHMGESFPDIVEYAVWKIAAAQGVSFERLFAQIPLYRWRTISAGYCGSEEWERVRRVQAAMPEMLAEDSWYRLIWEEAYLYYELFRYEPGAGGGAAVPEGTSESAAPDEGETMAETLYAYGKIVRRQAELLYRPELLESSSAETEEPTSAQNQLSSSAETEHSASAQNRLPSSARAVLPPSVQAAYAIGELQCQTSESKYAEAVGTLRTARELMPELSKCWKTYLGWLEKKIAAQREEQQAAQDEFAGLAEAVKLRARQCIRMGDTGAAESILHQLQAMVPNDAEVRELLAGLNC